MSPAVLVLNEGFEHEDYMHICYAMIDVCNAVCMQKDWQNSIGARMELQYAADHRKKIIYEDFSTKESGFPIDRNGWLEESPMYTTAGLTAE